MGLKKRISLGLLVVLFFAAGCMHFLKPEAFVAIMPGWIPRPDWMVALSGAAEIAGGAGIAVRRLRPLARWGLALLLVAVFPANIHMAINNIQPAGLNIPPVFLWARLFLQPVLIWWVLSATRE